MKTLRARVLISAVLLALTLALCLNGCADHNDLVKEKLREAFSHLEKSSRQIEELAGFEGKWGKAVSGGASPESAAEAKELLEEARAIEEAAIAELVKGAEGLERAASMQASEGMGELHSAEARRCERAGEGSPRGA